MFRAHRIERRLFEAVLVTLASSGCQPPPPAGPVGPEPDQVAVPPDAGVVVAAQDAGPPAYAQPPGDTVLDAGVAAPLDATVTTTIATAPVDAGPPAPAEPDAHAMCAAHKQREPSRASVRRARETAGPPQRINTQASWDPKRKVATCTIVRDQVEGMVTILHAPTCCPTGRTRQPCPPAQKMSVPGAKALVEEAELTARGKVVKSTLSWITVSAEEPPRHYCGRLPEGLQLAGERASTCETGAQLAAMAELEAASVPAFERLARELALHGAPAGLIRRARTAMRDEVRHARAMRDLAIAHGAVPRAIDVAALPCRALAAIARENAIEGCVREAYGALVATYQAETAPVALRATFAAIARDERRHAALAEDVDAWLRTRLAAAERTELAHTRRAALAELRTSLVDLPPVTALGVPGGAQAVALFDAYFAASAA